jgi:ABC-type siderophore export system fused ATPase/permease subunit
MVLVSGHTQNWSRVVNGSISAAVRCKTHAHTQWYALLIPATFILCTHVYMCMFAVCVCVLVFICLCVCVMLACFANAS